MNCKEFFATVYASENKEDVNKLITGYIQKEGENLTDFAAFKAKMDEIYDAMNEYKVGDGMFLYLVNAIDYKTEFAVNGVRYISERVAPKLKSLPTDQELFDAYTKENPDVFFPFSQRPTLSGGKAVIVNVKSQESKDFWRGYFDYAKKALANEKAEFEAIVEDESHELHVAYTIGNMISDLCNKLFVSYQAITSEQLARIMVYGKLSEMCVKTKDYDKRIADLQVLYDTTDIIITAKIVAMIKEWIGKLTNKG